MRILFLSPDQGTRWNPGHQHFRNEIGRQVETVYYGPGYELFKEFERENHIPTVLKKLADERGLRPDIIMTYGYRYTAPFTGLGLILNIPKVHFICDFTPPAKGWPGTIGAYVPMLKNHGYNMMFGLSYQVLEWFGKNWSEMKISYLPFGVDEKIFHPMEVRKSIDVYVGWSKNDAIYPKRQIIENELRQSLTGTSIKVLIKKTFQEAFVRTINRSVACLNTSNIFNTMNMKHFEVMACSSLLITDHTREFSDLGFIPDLHYIQFKTEQDLIEKILYAGNHPGWAESIADEGYEFTLSQHTNKQRVEAMLEVINESLF